MTATLGIGRDKRRLEALPGRIGFIGAGKVGKALATLLAARGVTISGISGRDVQSRESMLAASSMIFLTVPDDAIADLCRQVTEREGWREGQRVVHCSGALSSGVLQSAHDMGALTASFHPLQAFANLNAALDNLPGSTFALEGDEVLVGELEKLVRLLDGTALHLRAEDKILYHAAAAIASNYTVTLAALASDLLVREGVAPDPNTALHYLMPLLRGTIDNLGDTGLPNALTGPIARGDVGTVARHLEALEKYAPEMAHVYRHLARLTLPLAIEKGSINADEVQQLKSLLEEERPRE